MEMCFENKIEKLADIVVWADNQIEEMRIDLAPSLGEEEFKKLGQVEDFEAVKKVVLEAMNRHTVYTNALNKDIADKAAKIDLLEKEIEGRKEGYTALKELMDTKYISIDEHNNICKEYEDKIRSITKSRDTWFDTAGGHSTTIIEQSNTIKALEEKVKHQKENLDGINKTLEIKTKENERLIAVKKNQDKEIKGHESENARLSEKIAELKKQNEYLTKELNESYYAWNTDSKNHSKREMTLVDELGKKNKDIEKLKVDLIHEREKNEKLAKAHAELENDMRKVSVEISDKDKVIADLEESNRYLRRQSVKKGSGEINKLKEENKELKTCNENAENMLTMNSIEIMELKKAIADLKKKLDYAVRDRQEKEDDHGRKGFKEYIKWIVKEEETKYKESWKARLNEELEAIFKEEEEIAKMKAKLNEKFGVGGIVDEFKDDIPCGSDAIE